MQATLSRATENNLWMWKPLFEYVNDHSECQVACSIITRKVNLFVGFQKTVNEGVGTKLGPQIADDFIKSVLPKNK